ncbi:MAG: hypothetical protein SFY95_04780 [Planctomycetota bacterium]|nr:hypothetical protein [Planctomycetota bacterium]
MSWALPLLAQVKIYTPEDAAQALRREEPVAQVPGTWAGWSSVIDALPSAAGWPVAVGMALLGAALVVGWWAMRRRAIARDPLAWAAGDVQRAIGMPGVERARVREVCKAQSISEVGLMLTPSLSARVLGATSDGPGRAAMVRLMSLTIERAGPRAG